MNIPNIFQATEVAQLIDRINILSPEHQTSLGENVRGSDAGSRQCSL